MRVRNTGHTAAATPISPASGVGQVRPVEPAHKVRAAVQPVDTATVMAIPEVELTPKVQEAIGQLMQEVHRLRDELDQARKRIDYLEHLADQDTLAPVLNRRAFVRELTRFTSFAERYGVAGSVVYFDINGMKQINDELGHGAGDAALKHVAEVLLNSVRASDVVGRLGGDEFGVILAQSDAETAHAKATQLAEAIKDSPTLWEDKPVFVEAAFGVHPIGAGDEVDDALNAADRAMYAQKRGGQS